MRWPFSRTRENAADGAVRGATGGGISLNRDDNERLEKFARSARRIRVSRSLLGLAWTAGPVTAMGLYGGYYIGFGSTPSSEQLTYFISFTVLSGLIALAAKVVYDSTWGYAGEQAEKDVEEVIDKLGNLLLAVRDLMITSYEGESRRREAAVQLLERVNLSPGGVAFAAEELTGDRELGQLLAQVDTFRRAGLYSRIQDLHRQYGELFDRRIAELHQVSPVAADTLRQRYQGEAADLHHGVPRNEHFIERVLAAIEQDNLLLVTMADVESMLVLAFELINGRQIPMLIFNYRGRWRLASALHRMERQRSRYRVAQASASNRIRALASWLVEIDAISYDDVPEGLSSELLIERVMDALDHLDEKLRSLIRSLRRGEAEVRHQLRQQAETMATALRLYRAASTDYEKIGRLHADFLASVNEWNRLLEAAHNRQEVLRVGPGRRGLRIQEKLVELGEDERKAVCRHLVRYLRDQKLEARETKSGFGRKPMETRPLTFDSARQLAVEVALALEPHIHLSYPGVQRGIGATRSSYLGDLEPGMSARETRRLGETMAQDVDEDMGQAAEQLALALVRHYRVDLTDDARRFLHETYGARDSVLDILAQYDAEAPAAMSLLSTRPTIVPAAGRRWYRTLVHARRLVGDDRFTPPWLERLYTPESDDGSSGP
ncbi:MAG: hypothetical protein ACQETO_03555 [Pseudomonadota bacterium]